jgi:hypothetical protein
MTFTAQVVEVITSEALTEGSDTQVDNLQGLYRLASADSVVIYTTEPMVGWDLNLRGSVLGAGHSALVWFPPGKGTLSYHAIASTGGTPARLEKVRLIPDKELERWGL